MDEKTQQEPGFSAGGHIKSIFGSALSIIKYFSVAAIFFLPIDFLYRLDAFLDYLRPSEILCNSFEVVLFWLLYFGVFWGGIIGLFTAAVLAPFARKERMESLIHAFGSAILLTVAVFSFFIGLSQWAPGMFLVPENVNLKLVLGILSLLVVMLAIFVPALRQRLFLPLRPFTDKAFKALLTAAAVGLCLLVWRNVSTPVPASVTAEGKRPNVILISFDALTAEDMHLHGYSLETSPVMDSLANESAVFDQALSCSNITKPGSACIELGKYPPTSGIMHQHGMLDENQRNDALSAELKKLGYATASISANILASPRDIGLGRHFEKTSVPMKFRGLIAGYFEEFFYRFYPALTNGGYNSQWWIYHIWDENIFTVSVRLGKLLSPIWSFWWETHPHVTEQMVFKEGLDFIKERKGPFYLRLHIYQPHFPYMPGPQTPKLYFLSDEMDELSEQIRLYRQVPTYPESEREEVRKLRLRYDENIHHLDSELGKFISSLKEMGLFNDSLVIVTADHGDMFEKGFLGHGGNILYQPEIHIPLLIHEPGRSNGIRVAQPVSQVDIAATVLDIVGAGKTKYMDGVSLYPLMRGENIGFHPVFSMFQYGDSKFQPFRDGSISVSLGDKKYIYHYGYVREYSGGDKLFSITADPSENHNLLAESPDAGKDLMAEINKFIARYKNGS